MIQSYLEDISKIFFITASLLLLLLHTQRHLYFSMQSSWNILNATGILRLEGTAFGGFMR